MQLLRWFAALVSLGIAFPAAAEDEVPSLADLEAAGALIGEIRVDTHNIFDLGDPAENKLPISATRTRAASPTARRTRCTSRPAPS